LSCHGCQFSTKDVDNDRSSGSCAQWYTGKTHLLNNVNRLGVNTKKTGAITTELRTGDLRFCK